MKAEQERSIIQTSTTEGVVSIITLAQNLAGSNGMNIGVDHIFNAVARQMGPRLAIKVLSQNGIYYLQFIKDFMSIDRDFEKIEPGQGMRFTSRAKDVLRQAVGRAIVRGSPKLSEFDILVGIARHAQTIKAENERRRKEVYPYKIKKTPSSLFLSVKK